MTGAPERSSTAADRAYAALIEIVRGYRRDERLPGERELAGLLRTSRASLREALGRLHADGEVDRLPQRGWFRSRATVGEPPSVLLSFSEMAAARGYRATAQVVALQVRDATESEALALDLPRDAQVVALQRIRGLDGQPICVETVSLPAGIAAPLISLDLTDSSLYEALEEHCGTRIARTSYSIKALPATAVLAKQLAVDEGAALLVGSEVAAGADGRPVLTGTVAYRGDAYEFHADLYRPIV